MLTAIIEREGDGYVALCPELDIASQGNTVEQTRRGFCNPHRGSAWVSYAYLAAKSCARFHAG